MTGKLKQNLFDWGFYFIILGVILIPFTDKFDTLQYVSLVVTLSFFAGMGNRIIRDINDLKSDSPLKLKGKRYFTRPNELGTVYEEDENGNVTQFQDGQHY